MAEQAVAQGDTEAVQTAASEAPEGAKSAAETLYGEAPNEGAEQTAEAGESGEPAEGEEPKGDEGELDYLSLNYEAYPEGFALDEQAQGEFLELAKELGVKPDGVQKFIDFDAKRQQQIAESMQAKHAEQVAQWESEVKADKEIGGGHLDQTLATASKAIDAFAPEGFAEFLDQTGLGNHPLMVKTFNAIGKAISEDAFITGKEPVGAKSAAQTLYDNSDMK